MDRRPLLGWTGILRLGLVQSALGAIVVLTTSTMNRVMVVELALPALVPGLLVGLHHAVQILRPRLGHGSDTGRRRTPWIVGGMATLGAGALAASIGIALQPAMPVVAMLVLALAFFAIGLGTGAAGTSLLVLLATCVDPGKRAAAATITWVMMIVGFVVTAALAGHFLDPWSGGRLVAVTATVAVCAWLLSCVAIAGLERSHGGTRQADAPPAVPFMTALRDTWADADARRFTVFVFVSMLAYSAQDLILEPFAGIAFGYTPGESTQLGGLQNGGVLLGMALVGIVGTRFAGTRFGSLTRWAMGGCYASALALGGLVLAGLYAPDWPLRASVFFLGTANGVFAAAAIASMMSLASAGAPSREGVRMGLWGAAQAIAFGLGGLAGTAASDVARYVSGSPVGAYAFVFAAEALMFVHAANLAARVGSAARSRAPATPSGFGPREGGQAT
ncbi:MAG: BCD family MFS transporter [Lautropia sp.]